MTRRPDQLWSRASVSVGPCTTRSQHVSNQEGIKGSVRLRSGLSKIVLALLFSKNSFFKVKLKPFCNFLAEIAYSMALFGTTAAC
jgi:hypothetical protein